MDKLTLDQQLHAYFHLQEEIFDGFRYREEWRVFPMEDQRSRPWLLSDDKSRVAWSDKPFTEAGMASGEDLYGGDVYTYRNLDQHVWITDTLTMVLVDTNSDGNILLMVFRNAIECMDPALKAIWAANWG